MRFPAAVALLLVLLTTAAQGAVWTRHLSPDGSYSLHYPAGWKLTGEGTALQIDNPNTGEQLLLIACPVEAGQTARAVAEKLLENLREGLPSLRVTQWSAEEPAAAAANLTYAEKDRAVLGQMLILCADDVAFWFAYCAAEDDYSELRSTTLLQALASSLAPGAASKLPQVAIPELAAARLDRNARAFVFVLEFASGVAFSLPHEQAIIGELLAGWRDLSPAERARYDAYPALVRQIRSLPQDKLQELQKELHASLQPLLAEAADSPAMRLIRETLASGNSILSAGSPPLTAAAAEAYAELYAFAQALSANPKAGPEHIDRPAVAQIRQALLEFYPAASPADRQRVADLPGVWMALRMTFSQGSAEDKQRFRDSLAGLSAAVRAPAAPTSSGAAATPSTTLAASFLRHQNMLAIQQQTFNHYMWSRGFSGWTPMGKMW